MKCKIKKCKGKIKRKKNYGVFVKELRAVTISCNKCGYTKDIHVNVTHMV
jgi:hypothetical protein